MKIKEKLLLAFGLYIVLVIMGGVLTYNELRAITKRLVLVETADDITNTILEVRRHEKNFLLFKDEESLRELKEYLGMLKNNIDNIKSEIISEMGENNYNMMKIEIVEYEQLVNNLKENLKSKNYVDKMRLKARKIQDFTETLSKKERTDIDKRLKTSGNLLLFALLTVIILGAIINMKLARSIAMPIIRLEEITKKISKGDFSEHIEVRGKDEIASLEISFNQMEDRLEDAMASLELALKNLHEKQSQLVEAEKLATIGKFAAGVAHEINNPIAIINEKAGLMKDLIDMTEDFRYKEKFMGLIGAIFDSVNRCRTITHRILGFARRADITPEVININDAIKEVIGFVEKEFLYRSINLILNLKEDLPKIKSDKGQLQQVFLNIIRNAIDAVEDGGIVEISTDIKDENMARIFFKDNGHGIPEENIKHIFDPFFTTKEKEKGTGLGLSISYGIINNLSGNILVESKVNKGTTFTVEIPIDSEIARSEFINEHKGAHSRR